MDGVPPICFFQVDLQCGTDEIYSCLSRQNLWASRFVSVLLGNTQFMSSLMDRIWDLLHNQV